MKCFECGDYFDQYYCSVCGKAFSTRCSECHNEIMHGLIAYDTGCDVSGGNLTPNTEEDAQYFPGICDKLRPV